MASDAPQPTLPDTLDTGEAIRVEPWPDGRFKAAADVPVRGGHVTHHAFAETADVARDRLRFYVAALRGQDTSLLPPSPGSPHRLPPVVCAIKGTGRVMQCRRPGGPWPEHIPDPPAVEARCEACDGYKAATGALEAMAAAWNRNAGRTRN